MMTLYELLQVAIDKGASDLHLTVGVQPQIRIDGALTPLEGPTLMAADTKHLAYSILTDSQKHRFEDENELDFSFGIKGVGRFRGNLFVQRGEVGVAIRAIPAEVKSLSELGLPACVGPLVKKPHGLILCTGTTGSGKSTTLAAMINLINSEQSLHIMTIEDPIEHLHRHKKSLVNQREIASDTKTFRSALKHILRQDPDVVLIGEMRDLETIEAALTISETGHLTLATVHTNSSVQTIHRIVDAFPPHQQVQVRAQLSFVLQGVIAQQLIPRKNGHGRVLAVEVMIPNPAIRNLIREDKVHQIYAMMQSGQEKHGMVTMNQSLYDLYMRDEISYEDAIGRSGQVEELITLINRGGGIPTSTTGSSRIRRRE